MKRLVIRVDEQTGSALEAEYRRTFPEHGLSRNAWMLKALRSLLPASGQSEETDKP